MQPPPGRSALAAGAVAVNRNPIIWTNNWTTRLSDVMTNISIASGKERVGYPTQEPLKLLDRIIRASSNPGDVVLDPFCGCATTCVAAEILGRQWAGIDVELKARDLVIERLQEQADKGALLGDARLPDIHHFLRPPKSEHRSGPKTSRTCCTSGRTGDAPVSAVWRVRAENSTWTCSRWSISSPGPKAERMWMKTCSFCAPRATGRRDRARWSTCCGSLPNSI